MGNADTCADNIVIESFHSLLKKGTIIPAQKMRTRFRNKKIFVLEIAIDLMIRLVRGFFI